MKRLIYILFIAFSAHTYDTSIILPANALGGNFFVQVYEKMKRYILLVASYCLVAQTLQAQTELTLPYDATSLTEEQKNSNPDFATFPITLKDEFGTGKITKCDKPVEGLGPFSVSATTQVFFAPGNLQYTTTGTHQCADGTTQKGTWRFAKHQWDYVGNANNGTVYVNGVKCDNEKISDSYIGWIDMFCWGTSGWYSGAKQYYPWATSMTWGDYSPGNNRLNDLTERYAKADWGIYNNIDNDTYGTWRTLTRDEWVYLFHGRQNAAYLFGFCNIDGINGIIIFPDNWNNQISIDFSPSINDVSWIKEQYRNIYYYSSNKNNLYSINSYSKTEFQIIQQYGVVFLPAAGYRWGEMKSCNEQGVYWSSSHSDYGLNSQYNDPYTHELNFCDYMLAPEYEAQRSAGCSVRLVKIKNK